MPHALPHHAQFLLAAASFIVAAPAPATAQQPELDYRIDVRAISSGFDGKTCWAQARAGTIPGRDPVVVLTMQKLLMSASDVYFALNEMRSDDLGRTWSGPTEHATLGRRSEADGAIINVADFTPKWHAATRTLLGTGTTSHYRNEEKLSDPPSKPCFSVYDPAHRAWTPWARIKNLPTEKRFFHMSAGCSQRVDLPDGTVLLPVYFKPEGVNAYSTTVLRCSFDGRELTYLGHGAVLTFPFDPEAIPASLPFRQRQFDGRQAGLFEPSLIHFGGRYYLTLRNRHAGYVTSGGDIQQFDRPRPWTFDDGELLGNYNTQQHWVAHSDGVFLTYTRRGAKNDHVFRHRAPILIARVDLQRLCVLRSSERVLVPERGADIGNFSVTDVNENETWLTVSESMQVQPNLPAPPQARGANNHVYTARIIWNRPNRRMAAGG